MKRLLNVLAFIIIVGLTGSWECGYVGFREFLFGVGSVISTLFAAHIIRACFSSMKRVKRQKIA